MCVCVCLCVCGGGITDSITKGQSDSLEHIQKRAIYIIATHLQCKEAITRFNLPTIKDCLDILNTNFFRNSVDNDSHRLHYLLPKPRAVKRTLCSTCKYMNLQNAVQIDLKPVLFHMLFLTTRNKFYLYICLFLQIIYIYQL